MELLSTNISLSPNMQQPSRDQHSDRRKSWTSEHVRHCTNAVSDQCVLNGKWFFLFIRYSGPTSEGGLETSLLFLQGLVQSPCLLYVHGNPSQSGFTATTDVQLLCLDQSCFGLSAPQQYSPAALQSISSTWHCSHHLGAWTAPQFLASPSIHT